MEQPASGNGKKSTLPKHGRVAVAGLALLVALQLAIAALVSAAAWQTRHRPEVVDILTGETDVSWLLEYRPVDFALLANARGCRWDTGTFAENGLRDSYLEVLLPIGPHVFWYNGYAVLEPDDLTAALAQADDWEPADFDETWPAAGSIAAQLQAAANDGGDWTWLHSEAYDEQFTGLFCGYYFEPNRGIVIFDASTY